MIFSKASTIPLIFHLDFSKSHFRLPFKHHHIRFFKHKNHWELLIRWIKLYYHYSSVSKSPRDRCCWAYLAVGVDKACETQPCLLSDLLSLTHPHSLPSLSAKAKTVWCFRVFAVVTPSAYYVLYLILHGFLHFGLISNITFSERLL